VPDTWIRHDAVDLRRHRFIAAVLTGLCVVMAALFLVVPPGPATGPVPLSDRLWFEAVAGMLWVLLMVAVLNQARGRTLLTTAGMRFHTLTSRRFIRWPDIVDIEQGRPRSGYWAVVYVRRAHGRRLMVPGIYTHKSNDQSFQEKLDTIRYYWSRSTT
jgi:hypothetical protein